MRGTETCEWIRNRALRGTEATGLGCALHIYATSTASDGRKASEQATTPNTLISTRWMHAAFSGKSDCRHQLVQGFDQHRPRERHSERVRSHSLAARTQSNTPLCDDAGLPGPYTILTRIK